MSRLMHVLGVSATLCLSACVSTNATMLNKSQAPRPKIAADDVRIYRTVEQIKGKYEEVALLNSKGESNWTDENKMFNSMRKKAAELGANGILLDEVKEASAGAKVAGAFLGTGSQRKGKSIAIFVTPDSTKNH